MNNWKDTSVHVFGKSQTVVDVIFTYLGDKKNIKSIDVSCGCIESKLEGMFLKIALKLPKKYPQIDASVFEIEKSIYITYQDDTEEILTIKGTVHE